MLRPYCFRRPSRSAIIVGVCERGRKKGADSLLRGLGTVLRESRLMTGYEIIGAIGIFMIAAAMVYVVWEITREARRS